MTNKPILQKRSCPSDDRRLVFLIVLCVFLRAGQGMAASAGQESEAAGSSNASDTISHETGPSKIVCLQVIQDDYEGLHLSYPGSTTVDPVKNEIYITDTGNNRILVYTRDYFPLLTIGKPDGIEAPAGVAVDSRGYLFIPQAPTNQQLKGRISVLNPCLRWDRDIFLDGFADADGFVPISLAVNGNGDLYVAGSGHKGVVVLNNTGKFLRIIAPSDKLGTGDGQEEEARINDVYIDLEGHIYLLSEDMGRIYVYDARERFMFKFGEKGGGSGQLSRPRGVAADSRNKRIFVIDYMRHTASAYSYDNGRFLFEFGGMGWARGWFQYPTDIAVDASGNVLVADTFNQRVQVLRLEGIPYFENEKQEKQNK